MGNTFERHSACSAPQSFEASTSNVEPTGTFFCPDASATGSSSGPVVDVSCVTDAATSLSSGLRSRSQQVRILSRPPRHRGPICGFRGTLAERFWALVDTSGEGCWPWLGHIGKKGYGNLIDGSHSEKRKNWHSHVLAWVLTHGPVPAGKVIRHVVCGNRACCRPSHLKAGTQKENCEDTVRMGRTLLGEKNHQVKLTDPEVIDIRERRAAGESGVALAREKKVDPTLIYQICTGAGWPHLGGPRTATRARHLEPQRHPILPSPVASEVSR
jgi:hypothetical protein